MTALKKGFTLIELLIVMAILGVLAVVVLVAINPVQQLARTRDAGRKSGIAQIGRALEAYYTSHSGSYMQALSYLTTLSASGEISTPPAAISYRAGWAGTACDSGGTQQNNWCYETNAGSEAVVYTQLESDSERSKCPTAGQAAFFVWSTFDGRGGLTCVDVEAAGTTQVFID